MLLRMCSRWRPALAQHASDHWSVRYCASNEHRPFAPRTPQAHPFFAGVPWDKLYSSLAPPYRPPIEHELDTQNFEQYEDDHATNMLPPGSAVSRSRPIADPNFIGYTYKNWDAVHATQGG